MIWQLLVCSGSIATNVSAAMRRQGLNAPYLSTRTKLIKDAQTFGYHKTPAFA
jgi:hypothetical protein